MTGRVSSVQTMGAVDGPGIRFVAFMQGCPLRCGYCHNPETWETAGGTEYTVQELFDKIKRYKNYFGKNGGVTFSGGEPFMQAEFVLEVIKKCRNAGIHTAVDTSGSVLNEELIRTADLVILDIKMTNEEDYKKYTGGSLKKTLEFLSHCEKHNKDIWIRQVIVPGINDNEDNIKALAGIIKGKSFIKKVELLPFKKLCSAKYENLGIDFKFKGYPGADKECIEKLKDLLYKG